MTGVLIPKDKEFITLKTNLNILLRKKISKNSGFTESKSLVIYFEIIMDS